MDNCVSDPAIKLKQEKREVTYTAFGVNIENTIKLLSCSKKIDLIDKEADLRPKRMFITSQATIAEQKESFGWGKSGKRTQEKLEEIEVFGAGKMVSRRNYLDKAARTAILRKMKVDHILKLNELNKKYPLIEEFKKIAPSSVVFFNLGDVVPQKGTKAY